MVIYIFQPVTELFLHITIHLSGQKAQYKANSKKVVLWESKIQITKYKIQKKLCHITHLSILLTSRP